MPAVRANASANFSSLIDMKSNYAHMCELWHECLVMIHCHILMIKHITYSVSIDKTDYELYFQLTEMSEIIIIIGVSILPNDLSILSHIWPTGLVS